MILIHILYWLAIVGLFFNVTVAAFYHGDMVRMSRHMQQCCATLEFINTFRYSSDRHIVWAVVCLLIAFSTWMITK